MFPLGYSGADRHAYHRALADSHSIRTRIQVLTLDHEPIDTLTGDFLDGQVNVTADGEYTRSLTLAFLDRRRTYDFGIDTPANGAAYLDRMIRAHYEVKVPELSDIIDVPIFTGPVAKPDRAGDEAHVECHGKEVLAMGAAGEPMTVKKGTPKVVAIRRILRERGGETHFDFPDLNERLRHPVTLGRSSQPLAAAQRIAASFNDGGRQLFWDGSGTCRLRRFPDNPCLTFRDGNGGMVMGEPQVGFSSENLRNAAWVVGGVPKAKKTDETAAKEKERGVRHWENLPRKHPLSPWRQGREVDGDIVPRYLLERIENKHIRSDKAAEKRAQALLHRRAKQQVDVAFEVLPAPHLEEEDMIRIDIDGVSVPIRLGDFSIPLKHDQLMSIGVMRRVSQSERRRYRR